MNISITEILRRTQPDTWDLMQGGISRKTALESLRRTSVAAASNAELEWRKIRTYYICTTNPPKPPPPEINKPKPPPPPPPKRP